MKILYHHRIASKDGQYVHVEEIIGALRAMGHEVIVVEPASISQKEFGESSSLVATIRRYLPGFVHELAEFLYSIKDYLELKRVIRATQPEVIYERYNLFFPSGIWAAKKFGLPLLLEVNAPLLAERTEHGGLKLQRLAAWSERYTWRNADAVLPVTGVLAGYIRRAGVNEHKIVVIPNGINAERFSQPVDVAAVKQQLGITADLVLGFTGFVREWHRLDRIIDLLAEHPDQNWHLMVVGDGPVCIELKQRAKRLGVAGKVSFLGIVSRDQIINYVSCFDIALQPDVVEYASPLKLFEYLVLGKAVVAPDKANIRELLTAEVNALLFDPNSGESLKQQVARLCESAELRGRLGDGARQLVDDQKYYWHENAAKIVGLFDQLLREQQKSNAGVAESGTDSDTHKQEYR